MRWMAFGLVLVCHSALAAADRLPVVASFSILGDWVAQVGADHIALTVMVGPDQDVHVFEPGPRVIAQLARAKVLVLNGLGLEGWIGRLAQSAQFKGIEIVASDGLKPLPDGQGVDPHAFQDPVRAQHYIRNIADGLAKADPANAADYRRNAARYITQLQGLTAWTEQRIAQIPAQQRQVITSHDAFAYFAARFGVRFYAPQGVNTHAEASAQVVGRLIEQIRASGIRAVFLENITDPRLLRRLAQEAGVNPTGRLYSDALSAPGGPAGDYLTLQRYNVGQLVAGMRQNRASATPP